MPKSYYESIKYKSDKIFRKYNMSIFIPNLSLDNYDRLVLIYKEKFNSLLLKIFNSKIHNIILNFTKEEVTFIIDFQIDKIMKIIIEECKEVILFQNNSGRYKKGAN